MRPCLPVIQQFSTPRDAQDYYQQMTWNWWDKFRNRPQQGTRILEEWLDVWDCWMDLADAVQTAVRENKLLV